MAKAKVDANWVEVQVATLPVELAQAYQAYKAQYATMKEAREAFEQAMSDASALPTGKRMVFGYNFGKLSVAVVDDDRKASKPKAGTQSLADFLKSQGLIGARA